MTDTDAYPLNERQLELVFNLPDYAALYLFRDQALHLGVYRLRGSRGNVAAEPTPSVVPGALLV